MKNGNPNLLVLEACTDIPELLIDAEALLLFVLAIAYVADEHREASHPWQRHRRSDPHSHTHTRTHAQRERNRNRFSPSSRISDRLSVLDLKRYI